ncbi:acyltransferase family protein [Paraburkholderia sediminicola]|uniref:acyltransferase family protein n=1 Tax=Paraburkholderia sediminicola TaxID=458836 RepID=UPI0038BC964C
MSIETPFSSLTRTQIAVSQRTAPRDLGQISASTRSNYYPDIDGLRAVAVLCVVLYHAFPTYLPGGFVGVDIFFVISGYLIGSILIEELKADTFSFGAFYARRIKRIFPALLCVLVACYAFGWFNLLDTEFMQLGKHVAAGAGFVSNLALWTEAGYFDASAESKPLLHLWSLAVEEQFYLIWPVVLLLSKRFRVNLLVVVLIVGIGSFALNMVMINSNPTADFYSPFTRFWELMIGCGLAYRHTLSNHQSGTRSDRWSLVGCLLIALAVVLLRGQVAFPGWRALLPTIGAYLVIGARGEGWINRKILAARPLVWIGLISFPLYLWHWPLLVFPRILAGDTPAWTIRVAALLASVVMAWLTYRFIERPVRYGSKTSWKVAGLALAMCAIGFVGFNTYQRHGLAFRFNKTVTQFTGDAGDSMQAWREGRCFLQPGHGGTEFAPECTDSGTGPLVFLWGDSFAAALSPGLEALQQNHAFRLAQHTASGCPPLLSGDAPYPDCVRLRNRAFEILRRVHPTTVILASDWSSDSLDRLGGTVAALRSSGFQDIVMVGPVPHWRDTLPKIYWIYWRKNHQILPAYTRFELDPQTEALDRQAQAIAKGLTIRYVSAYQQMCNSEGCETRIGPGKGVISASDAAHLTPAASVALMNAVGSNVLSSTSLSR